jgi:hypothetical protein
LVFLEVRETVGVGIEGGVGGGEGIEVLPATLAAYKVPFCGRSVLVGVSEITI